MRLNLNPTVKNMAIGAVSEEVFRQASFYALGKAKIYDIYFRVLGPAPASKWIWGIGTNDLLSLGVGAGMMLYGMKKRSPKFKEIALGWFVGFTCAKLIAEPLYGLIMAYDPVYEMRYSGGAIMASAPMATGTKYRVA